MVGGFGGGGTPGPFSNPVVKPTRADGTWSVGSWESRSLPTHLSFDLLCSFRSTLALDIPLVHLNLPKSEP